MLPFWDVCLVCTGSALRDNATANQFWVRTTGYPSTPYSHVKNAGLIFILHF